MIRQRLHQARKLLAVSVSSGYRRGLRLGVAASVEHERIVRALSVATLVDVGANVGQFTLLVRSLHPRARVHAFEPLAEPAEVFARLFADDPLVTLHRVAVGPEESTAEMHVSRRHDSSSLLPITERQTRFAPGTDEVGLEHVAVRRLDQVLTADDLVKPALLKLDVQGFELSALAGCEALLDRFDHVYAEVSFVPLYEGQALADEVIDFLARHGFRLAGVNDPSFDSDGRCVQVDVLFTRRDEA